MKNLFIFLWLSLASFTSACNTVTPVVVTHRDSVDIEVIDSIEDNSLPRITISQATLKAQKDVAKYLQARITAAHDNTTFILPEGEYILNSGLLSVDKTIALIGGGGTPGLRTHFLIYHTDPAITITSKKVGSRIAYIENIRLSNRQNTYLSTSHGIVSTVVTRMKDVEVLNFGGDGIYLWGDGGSGRPESYGSNVSFCHFESVTVAMCRGNGISIQGGDANAGHFENIDIRDNWQYGIYDNSFLGNHWVSTMAHNNRRGNYMVPSVNSRSTFTGCYSEGGSPLSYFHGNVKLFGGLWDGGVILEGNSTADIIEQVNPYEQLKHDWINGQMFKIFRRKISIDSKSSRDSFQWRLYDVSGGFFKDKSDQDFETAEQAEKDIKSKLENVK